MERYLRISPKIKMGFNLNVGLNSLEHFFSEESPFRLDMCLERSDEKVLDEEIYEEMCDKIASQMFHSEYTFDYDHMDNIVYDVMREYKHHIVKCTDDKNIEDIEEGIFVDESAFI